MNKGYQNLKQLETATIAAINQLEAAIITEGNTASHQLGEVKKQVFSALKQDRELWETRAIEQNRHFDAVEKRVYEMIEAHTKRGFWSRLNWLLTGR